MKKVRLLITTFLIILKKVVLLADAYIILFGIDICLKIIQFQFIFRQTEIPNKILLMFIFSFVIRYLFILIYDFRKKDDFSIEKIKENKFEIENEMTKKIAKYSKFKIFGNYILFVVLIFYQPIFMVIYYRKGNHRWDGIPNLRIFFFFVLSIFSSTLALFLSFTGISKGVIILISWFVK